MRILVKRENGDVAYDSITDAMKDLKVGRKELFDTYVVERYYDKGHWTKVDESLIKAFAIRKSRRRRMNPDEPQYITA